MYYALQGDRLIQNVMTPTQENIELAKKDWELSHLQSLRKEEERLAEEEADDIQLTYDRPETSNKVTLRRRADTGTWEVCSLSPPPALSPDNKQNGAESPRNSEADVQSNWKHRHKHRRGDPQALDSSRNSHKQSSKTEKSEHNFKHIDASSNHLNDQLEPPSDTPKVQASTRRHSSRLDAHLPDCSPPSKALDPRQQQPLGTGKNDRSPKLSNEVMSPTLDVSNHLDKDFISLRTRNRSQVSSPMYSPRANEHENSPNHKYPTRHKLAGTS